jgi:hypothetical protein
LIYRIEPDCGPLVPDLLKFLAHAYSDELVDIDTAVGNPARLTKVYGTMTRKGDSTGGRKPGINWLIFRNSPYAKQPILPPFSG